MTWQLLTTLMTLTVTCMVAMTWALPREDEEAGMGMVGEGGDDLYGSPQGVQARSLSKRGSQEGIEWLTGVLGSGPDGAFSPWDISKLLLKHLRFRQLPEPASSLSEASPSSFQRSARRPGHQEKRHEQRMLVNNLAALLSGLRERQVESSMRMPSLRFGK